VLDALRSIIDEPDPPRSDAALADELARRGYRVARRTVAKYRSQLGVKPPSLVDA
jgi:RNA polymerase sigma-54 factor